MSYGVRARASIVSPVYTYSVFAALYTLFPLYYVYFGTTVVSIELPKLTQILVTTSCLYILFTNLTVILLLYLKGNFFRCFVIRDIQGRSNLSNMAIYFFIFFSPIVLSLVYYYPWPKFGESTTIFHTVATFSKTLLLVIFCSCAYLSYQQKLKSKYLTLFFLFMLFINFVDTARTHLFIGFFAYILGCNWRFSTVVKKLPFVIFVFFCIYLSHIK